MDEIRKSGAWLDLYAKIIPILIKVHFNYRINKTEILDTHSVVVICTLYTCVICLCKE